MERYAFHNLAELRNLLNKMTEHDLHTVWPAEHADQYVLSISEERLSDDSVVNNYAIKARDLRP
jgi:hypothetical protein